MNLLAVANSLLVLFVDVAAGGSRETLAFRVGDGCEFLEYFFSYQLHTDRIDRCIYSTSKL